MADTAPAPAPAPAAPKAKKPSKPKAAPKHAGFNVLVVEAIAFLKDRTGSSLPGEESARAFWSRGGRM